MKRFLSLLFVLMLTTAFVGEAFAQRSFGRGGGFGGGRSSFGGSSRSSGGSFFGGGGSSSSGSFSRPSAPSYSGPRSSSSFGGRSGSFGNSGRVNSSSINPNRNYGGSSYGGNRTTVIYGGQPYYSSGGFWSGYALGTMGSPWTHYMPFHPGFYTYSPYYSNGVYYEGGFSFTRFIIGIALIIFVIWLLIRLFGGGGGRNIRYTNYR